MKTILFGWSKLSSDPDKFHHYPLQIISLTSLFPTLLCRIDKQKASGAELLILKLWSRFSGHVHKSNPLQPFQSILGYPRALYSCPKIRLNLKQFPLTIVEFRSLKQGQDDVHSIPRDLIRGSDRWHAICNECLCIEAIIPQMANNDWNVVFAIRKDEFE